VNRASSLVLHGEEGARWRFQWRMKETTALAKTSRWIRSARACSS
jgi:enterochelin esterase family protein